MNWLDYCPEDPEAVQWDVAIIGTGMGGGTIGHQLAKAGMKVLFIEMGGQYEKNEGHSNSWGSKIQKQFNSEFESIELRKSGRLNEKILFHSQTKSEKMYLPLGCGPGGSTVLYGAALERMKRIDFDCSIKNEDTNDSNFPTRWPIDYDAFCQYYAKAELLYKVRGTPDPLDPDDDHQLPMPPTACGRDEFLMKTWLNQGLHPYKMHIGISYIEGCEECLGVICNRECKSDSATNALKPALQKFGASLLLNCRVLKLNTSKTAAKSIEAIYKGKKIRINSKVIIVAAGAINSPALLQRSVSSHWPNGLGNDYDLVGRNLMFHTSDFFAVWPKGAHDNKGPHKTIALNDLYVHQNRKLGCFQSVGVEIKSGQIFHYFKMIFLKWTWPLKNITLQILRLPAYFISLFFRNAGLFATIIEDYPYYHNRVKAEADTEFGIEIHYKKSKELLDRIQLSRRAIHKTLKPCRSMLLNGDENLNYGHPCGSCRMGISPNTSVLTSDCNIHGVENVYVVDASFFPTSSGVNPSLTIAANALRVADIIIKKWS